MKARAERSYTDASADPAALVEADRWLIMLTGIAIFLSCAIVWYAGLEPTGDRF